MKFGIVFEDENVIVVNKPSGLVVNRSQTEKKDTLQDQLAEYFKLNDLGIGERAGIVHRLDKDTSGLLVTAKKQKVFEFLQSQFNKREIIKEYIALVHANVINEKGTIRANIGRIGKFGKFGVSEMGRESRTDYNVVKRYLIPFSGPLQTLLKKAR